MNLETLKNIGPVTAKQLAAIGITTAEQLCEFGPIYVYKQLRARFPRVTKTMLYALEGARLDLHWNELPTAVKQRLNDEVRTLD